MIETEKAEATNAPHYEKMLEHLSSRSDLSSKTKYRRLIEVKRTLCKTDLYFLTKEILGYSALTDDYHKVICDTIMLHKKKEQLHLHPRGHFKSTIITISENIQDLLIDNNYTILIVNAVLGKAKAFLKEIKSHFKYNDNLLELFPEHRIIKSSQEGTQEDFTLPSRKAFWIREPSIEVTGIDKAVVSAHYDKIVFDDVINGLNVRTPEFRQKISDSYKEYRNLLNPPGRVRTVGTRWHWFDVYGELIQLTKLMDRTEQQDDNSTVVFITQAEKNGIPVFPERFPLSYLHKLKLKQGPYIYSCQMMNDPQPKEERIFTIQDIRFVEKPSLGSGEFLNKYLCVDPGIQVKETSDPTAILVIAVNSDSDIFVIDIDRGWWNPDQTIDHILSMAMKHNVKKMGIESIAYQKTLSFYLNKEMRNRGIWYTIEEVKRNTRIVKEDRIKRIQPYTKAGKIYIVNSPETLSDNEKNLLDELDTFPYGRYDDILDCLADCIEIMSVPPKKRPQKVVYQYADTSSPYRTGRKYKATYVKVGD